MSVYECVKISLAAATLVATQVAANAADATQPPVRRTAASVIYDWTGLYAGGHVGFGSGDGDSGVLGGGQVGYNFQSRQWVFGVEADLSAASQSHLDWVSTLAGRVGWTFDRWLVYGKLGGAWANVTNDGFVKGHDVGDKTVSGWVLGVGAEYALQGNWTAKIEYDMMDLGSGFDNVHVIKAGVNYRFGFDPRRR